MPTVGAINKSPAKPAFDLGEYEWLIEQWLADCETRTLANTVRVYRQKIRYFLEWWREVGPSHNWLITEKLFAEFELHLRTKNTWLGKPLAYHTRCDAIRRLSEMLHWAYRNDYANYDLAKWLPTVQGSPPVRHAATLEQLAKLVEAADKTTWPERSRAILALLLGAGLRRSESVAVEDELDESALSGLLIENIVFHAGGAGVMNVTGKRTQANPCGVRQVAFDATVGAYLVAYIDTLENQNGSLLRHARFRDRPVGHRGVYYVVKECIRLACLEDVIDACHQLRRNYGHYWVKLTDSPLGADMLRRNYGHAHFKQTSDYTMISASDIVPYAHSPLSEIERKKK